jgi:hypothetical protein
MWVLVIYTIITGSATQLPNGNTTFINGFSSQATCSAAAAVAMSQNSSGNHLETKAVCVQVG